MRILLMVGGFGWALLGVFNLFNLIGVVTPGRDALQSGLGWFALIFNVVLFILPGAICGELGWRTAQEATSESTARASSTPWASMERCDA